MALAALAETVGEGKIRPADDFPHPLGNHAPWIACPESEEEMAAILRAAHEHRFTVIPAGGGTKRGMGGVLAQADLLLQLSAWRGITEYSPGDLTVTVRAGTTILEIARHLAAHGQMLPLDPSWPELATIGGVVAANDSGPRRLRYGSARDHVIGMRLVYPDGRIIRTGGKVVKNVAGYDMNKLFVGSMGTLGVISEITLKLRPLPPCRSLVLITFSRLEMETLHRFVAALMDSTMEPVSLELISPALCRRLTGRDDYALAVAFEDEEKAVRYQEAWVRDHAPQGVDLEVLREEEAADWWFRFARLAPCGAHPADVTDSRIALKMGSKNMDVLAIVRACHELGERHGLVVEAHGGAGHGISRAFVSGEAERFLPFVQDIRSFVRERGGYAIVQHASLALRRELDVWGEKPAYFSLLDGIKRAVDPHRVLNPQRFVGGI